MAKGLAFPTPGVTALDAMNVLNASKNLAGAKSPKLAAMTQAKAKKTATDFEAMFLNSMFQNMFTGISGEGPFGGSGATGVWRSFLTDEYSKSFAKAGGIGLSDTIYRELLARQSHAG